MDAEELAQFITWNFTALSVELGEMMAEVGWKPWASSRHVDYTPAYQEMVDAWHFFLNILLALGASHQRPIDSVARDFESYYVKKNAKNLQRQVEGYDGVKDKCLNCHRALEDQPFKVMTRHGVMCSQRCANEYTYKGGEEMTKKSEEELRELREGIEQRSGEGRSASAEEVTEAAQEKHRQAQAQQGFGEVIPLLPPEVLIGAEVKNPKALRMIREAEHTGEPVFCFRARDFFSIQIIAYYADIVERYGPDDAGFHQNIIDSLGEFKDWQKANIDKVRYPD